MTEDETFMQVAIDKAREGVQKGCRPFGAALVKNGEVVATAYNSVEENHDPTGHAETNVIRKLCTETKNKDLSEYTIYATCEPCPMCTSAIVWANIKRVVFGSQRDDLKAGYRRQHSMYPEKFYKEENLDIEIVSGVLRKEVLELYQEYLHPRA